MNKGLNERKDRKGGKKYLTNHVEATNAAASLKLCRILRRVRFLCLVDVRRYGDSRAASFILHCVRFLYLVDVRRYGDSRAASFILRCLH
jgi:hypothetical protein